MAQKFWLMKSEPETYSIDQLQKDKKTPWSGVRNYQARNFMMNDMNIGDLVIFYHSNATPPGAAGVATICKKATPDITAQNPKSEYYDPKARKEKPIWFCVEVEFKNKFKNFVDLARLRDCEKLSQLQILKRGNRLSITPLNQNEFETICDLGK